MAATPAPVPADAVTPNQHQATITTLAQYIKDFSFENPNAPNSLQPRQVGPQINCNITVNTRQLAPSDFEVELKLEGDSKVGTEVLFAFDLTYSGTFRLINVPPEHVQGAIMVECPRQLFPFARHTIAEAVRAGGFPPLYLDPIDFNMLFQQMVAQQTQAQAQAEVEAGEARVLN